jgi:hypothetical protein
VINDHVEGSGVSFRGVENFDGERDPHCIPTPHTASRSCFALAAWASSMSRSGPVTAAQRDRELTPRPKLCFPLLHTRVPRPESGGACHAISRCCLRNSDSFVPCPASKRGLLVCFDHLAVERRVYLAVEYLSSAEHPHHDLPVRGKTETSSDFSSRAF